MKEMPAIEKIKGVTEYEFQQSKYYPECPRVPMRTCLVSGSGGGKTTTILAMCLQIYGFEVFQRIIVVSPSIGIDDAWNPLFAEMRKRGIDPKEFTLDHYDDAWLMKHLDEQRAITEYCKKQQMKKQLRELSLTLMLLWPLVMPVRILLFSAMQVLVCILWVIGRGERG